MRSLAASSLLLAVIACAPASRDTGDAGPTIPADAGPLANGPLPAPLLRVDDHQDGVPRIFTTQGKVVAHGAVTEPPASLNVTPASHLDINSGGNVAPILYYTFPIPYRMLIFPNDQVKLTFKEAVGEPSAPHSYGLLIRKLTDDSLITLVEDGASGPAFTAAEQLGFEFALDTAAPATLREPDACGDKAHYPGTISQGGRSEYLFPGQSALFSVNGVDMKFTLLDLYRFENSTCGAAPELSIAYLVQPKT